MIALAEVTKSFSGVRALGPLDLGIARGATTVVIGPSGCGKSTLLRLLVGLLTSDRGQVRINRARVDRSDLRTLRRGIGYVIQEGGLFPHLTVRENLRLAACSYGETPERIRSRIDDLAEMVKLPPSFHSRYPSQLSGGQRQRVALMRALMLDPDLLLLDEPLGSLDPMIRAELQTDLKAVFDVFGKTVVLVTHDLHEAAYFADTVVLMRDGRIVQQGPMRDLLEHPADAFVSEFVRAQRSFLPLEGTRR